MFRMCSFFKKVLVMWQHSSNWCIRLVTNGEFDYFHMQERYPCGVDIAVNRIVKVLFCVIGTIVRLYIQFHNLPAVWNTTIIYGCECIPTTPPIFNLRAKLCRRERGTPF